MIFGDGQRASKSGHSNYQVFMFGSYFGLRVDLVQWNWDVALVQWNWDVSDPCFSQLSLFTWDAMALCLGFFGFKLDWVSIDCGLFVRTSFKSSRLMTELFKTS